MKRPISHPLLTFLLLFFLSISINQCGSDSNSTYDRIIDSINGIKVINTHEHQHWPEEYGDYAFHFYNLVSASYLNADIRSSGSPGFEWDEMDTLDLDQLWDKYGSGLDYTRNTSYYSQFVKGFQTLYGFDDLFFTRSNIDPLSEMIEENYKDYPSWLDKAFGKAGFEVMFLDQYWNPFNCEVDERFFALVFHINPLVSQVSNRPEENETDDYLYKHAEEEGFIINNLDDYLAFCDHLFGKNLEHKAVCIKNSLAYSRTLYFEEVPYETARLLFDKSSSSLTPDEKKMLQDFVFHRIIQKSIEYDLPIQIHTGYLAGNGNILENGKPVKLNNLFLRYPDARFILFHGGYPWTGEFAALGKMFPNVYLDLVWLPQISRESAIRSLDEMLDCVPYNKFFWGGDCHFIEESTGSLEFGKDVVAEVLSLRVKRGLLTEELACEIAQRIFRENAIEVFNLPDKLGRDFK